MSLVREAKPMPFMGDIFQGKEYQDWLAYMKERALDEQYVSICAPLATINSNAEEACVRARSTPQKILQESQNLAAKVKAANNDAPQTSPVMMWVAVAFMVVIAAVLLKKMMNK